MTNIANKQALGFVLRDFVNFDLHAIPRLSAMKLLDLTVTLEWHLTELAADDPCSASSKQNFVFESFASVCC